jgi:Trp operon repressor
MEPSRHRPKADSEREEVEEPEIRWTVKKFVDTFITAIPQEFLDILDAATDAGLPERKVETLLRKAVREKLIYRQQAAKNRPAEYATVPFPEPENKVIVVRRLLEKEPQLSNREAAEQLSVSHTLVNRVRRELETLSAGNNRVETA